MAGTPESKVKTKIRKILDEFGVKYIMPTTWGYGRRGPLDFSCSVPPHGRHLDIEAKSIYTDHPVTALQEEHISQVKETGAPAIVIDETTIHLLPELLKCMMKKSWTPAQNLEFQPSTSTPCAPSSNKSRKRSVKGAAS